MGFCIIYVTHANENAAKALSSQIVEEKLAACANLFPIQSAYWWQGALSQDDEYVSILKTTNEKWPALKVRVTELHPYEVPCIMKIEVEANESYEQWIRESVQQNG